MTEFRVTLTKATTVTLHTPHYAEIEFTGPKYQRLTLTPAQAILRLMDKRYDSFAGGPLDVPRGNTINPYWEIVRLMKRDATPWMDPWAVEWFGEDQPTRTSLVKAYAWAIPSPADLLWMHDILDGQGVVEIGAGSGYWAWQLDQLGVDVKAYDNWDWRWRRHWFPVQYGNTRQARLHSDRALMLIWPPYSSPMAKAALDFYDGDLLFYAGEGDGGCTADEAFHAELDRSWTAVSEAPHHPTFDGIHCRLTAYRRNAEVTP